jgi:cytochrome c oxidase accessory protein FixG
MPAPQSPQPPSKPPVAPAGSPPEESDPALEKKQKVRLAVYDHRSSLRRDGSREQVVPADVKGRFTTARHLGFVALIAIWALLPWIPIGGHPAVFLDVPARRFFLFGATFNSQDFWLAFFLITGVLFTLIVLTTTLGRVWCGWACPQTVFLEGLFRPIERLIEGPRNTHIARDAGDFTFDKAWRKGLKHVLFVAMGLFVAHVFLAYFVSIPSLFHMVAEGPAAHPTAFAWTTVVGLVLYGNFAFFREQLCLVICPYGRLQSVMTDDDSMVVGYDEKRGEPRGKGPKGKREGLGACVDCGRCVAVCPTNIDIRHGLQVDCIGCTQCIDACDEIMDKLGEPRGLVRYDSLRGLRHEPRRFLRPRVVLYAFLGLLGLSVAAFALHGRESFHAQLLRMPGSIYVLETTEAGEVARNQFDVHLVNASDETRHATIAVTTTVDGSELLYSEDADLEGMRDRHITVIVRAPVANIDTDSHVTVTVAVDGEPPQILISPVLGPTR